MLPAVVHSSASWSPRPANALQISIYSLATWPPTLEGQRWKLLDLHGPLNQPITADIQQATHADAVLTKTVCYETLQNLSATRETVDIYADQVVNLNDYIFYTDPEGLTCSGKVTAVHNDIMKVLQ